MNAVRRTSVAGIFWGGLIAGTVDVGGAALINWRSPEFILQAIASGLLGRESFQGGVPAAVLGYTLQCAMSVLIATIYALGTTRLPAWRARWLPTGFAFGVVVFFVMEFVVVPLSAVGHLPHFTVLSFFENLVAMLLFGAIIAFFVRGRPASVPSDPALDEALEESFPASDPVAIHVDTETPSDTGTRP